MRSRKNSDPARASFKGKRAAVAQEMMPTANALPVKQGGGAILGGQEVESTSKAHFVDASTGAIVVADLVGEKKISSDELAKT